MANLLKACCDGTVTKVIRFSPELGDETVEISLAGAEPLYREIRILNSFEDEMGIQTSLLPGARVRVTIEVEIAGVIRQAGMAAAGRGV